MGLSFSSEGVPNLQKVDINKIATPYFDNKIFMTPHHQYTVPPKQAKVVLKSVFLNKIHYLWSSSDSLHFGHLKFMISLFFFPKIYDPQYIWDPHSKENDSPPPKKSPKVCTG